ncbi:MAG: hypothetical protein Q4C59_03055 [Lachnospiraceae bacterium]|nr:hypothetical protein [Lachnospiraceae bacterium]
MAITKKDALSVVFSCAPEYKKNLVDRSLLFVCREERYSEIVYSAKKVDWSRVKLPKDYEYLPLPKIPEASAEVVQQEFNQESKPTKNATEIVNAIATYRDLEWNDEQIISKLRQRFSISEDEAIECLIKAEI